MRPIIAVAELKDLIESGADLRVLDCRFDLAAPLAGDQAFIEAHIPGARRADLDRHLSGPPSALGAGRHPLPAADAWAECLSDWQIDPGTLVVAYDDAGGCFAARAWWLLRFFGHPRAAVLDGGWPGWLALGGEQEEGQPGPLDSAPTGTAPQRTGAEAAPAAVRDAVVLMDELAACLLVDARDPQRYAGVHEPIDPRAGHIPGARNRFWKANLDPDGFFLAPEVLRAQWMALLDGRPPSELACYCGSGVTACHNLLALAHAGIEGARLYPGSWSEYCSDPSRPAATGAAIG